MGIVQSIFLFLRAFMVGRATVAVESRLPRAKLLPAHNSAACIIGTRVPRDG